MTRTELTKRIRELIAEGHVAGRALTLHLCDLVDTSVGVDEHVIHVAYLSQLVDRALDNAEQAQSVSQEAITLTKSAVAIIERGTDREP
jgi:hypothetical protein